MKNRDIHYWILPLKWTWDEITELYVSGIYSVSYYKNYHLKISGFNSGIYDTLRKAKNAAWRDHLEKLLPHLKEI